MAAVPRSLTVAALVTGLALTSLAVGPHNTPLAAAAEASGTPTVSHLRTNALTEPIGISAETPRLSWQQSRDSRGLRQEAYQVRVASSVAGLTSPDVWDSGKVASSRSQDVAYGGPALTSHSAYHWAVRVWDEKGTASAWSEPTSFETGLLAASDWSADWVGAPVDSIGPEWSDYTIEFTASDISGALGVYFRGRDTEHAYMWQISQAERSLRPHVKNNGYSVLSSTAFPTGFNFAATHRYAVTVDGTTISTTVDGTLLDERTDSTHTAPGIVGFRTNGAETGLVHDVTVTSEDGSVLVDTDFPDGDRTFTAGTVTDGGLLLNASGGESWLAVGDEVPLLRDDFTLEDKPVASARVYAAAQGLYELQMNGEEVGDQELAPGWTDYRKRIQYQTYDVTDLLQPGANAWGAEVADGWFAGKVAMFGTHIYGNRTAVVAQLRVKYADGSVQVVGTDGTWRTTPGATTSADLLDGEAYDARRAAAIGDWSQPGYTAGSWKAVDVLPSATNLLEPQDDQPVRVTQELDSEPLPSPDADTHLYDLGQNMVGHARVTLTGSPGQTVRLRFAEVLNRDGSIYTANLRGARATDYYTFATNQPETYEPSFTFHGFRYVEITGLDSAPAADAVTGVVLGTDGDLVSDLQTSSRLVNQLHSNIVWGQRGNFLSVPTDTPARDERMGWTGDINVFSRTAVYNMDSRAFLNKWMQDLRDTQRADGAYPGVAPVIPGRFDGGYGPAGWADAGVHVPWTVWQAYDDTRIIRDNYEAMKKFVGYLEGTSTNGIRNVGGYNDWLNLDDPTPVDVIDTAFVAKSTRELSQMAAAIGNEADAETYRDRFEAIREAYQDAFISADGTVKGDSQTGYILTITNDLVPDGMKAALAQQFVQTIERRGWHLSTGFLGVDGLLPALSAVDRTDVAYRLLQNEDYPSWGYEIGKGATTIWERWNSIMPDGSFGPIEMNSFNHYAYGAVGEWMYRTMAGVSAQEPGYKQILIAPEPGQGIDSSAFSHETPYGSVRSSWTAGAEGMKLDVTVPGNTSATVRIPAPSRWAVVEGGRPAASADGVRFVRMDGDVAVLEVGSGSYSFAIDNVLGHIGDARDGVAALSATVNDVTAAGRISPDTADHLREQLTKLAAEVLSAWDAAVAGDDVRAAAAVHRALSTQADLDRWVVNQAKVQKISAADATTLRNLLGSVERELSGASAGLVGAVATLVPPTGERLPGDTVRVEVRVENLGTQTLRSITSSVQAPAGWTVTPTGVRAGSAAPGATVVHAYDVTVPQDARPGSWPLSGSVSYTLQSSSARLPVSASLLVGPPVVVDSVSLAAPSAHPGDTVELEATLTNRTAFPRTGTLQVDLPDGWTDPEPATFAVAGSGSTTVTATVEVPLSVTQGAASIVASIGDTDLESGPASLDVTFVNPPGVVLDHVDLGVGTAETAHGLTASQSSGTNVEAGLTRRYTNSAAPGGWFEFDLAVPKGEPFILRSVETYDQAQFKTYDVLVDGITVEQRRYRRTAGGMASLSYQFVVDEAAAVAATEDGVVRVRYQDVDADYDPSIADVWATPVMAGLDG